MSEIKGLNNLLKKLDNLGGDVEKALYPSVNKMGLFVQGEAKELCPVDTGDLKQSIICTTVQANNKISSVISTNSDHAPYVEFGTGKVGENTHVEDKYPGNLAYKQDKWRVNIPDVGVRWIEGQPAQPYLYPALKNNRNEVIKNIKEDLQEAIREISK
jgi:HK97 gp10 family phage protein